MLVKNLNKYLIFNILLLLFCSGEIFGQANSSLGDPFNNWDGHTYWSDYMRFSSRYFGPNALPVPDITKGSVVNEFEFQAGFAKHFSEGDNTTNITVSGNFPLALGRASLKLLYVPLEYYYMDSATRRANRTFAMQGEGYAHGDLYFETNIQLYKETQNLPNLSVRLACRTASGDHLSEARYTDMPGYYFDVSASKTTEMKSPVFKSFLTYCMLGFYCWQTNGEIEHQNDALLYGAGFDLVGNNLIFSINGAGYMGYIGNGDKPFVVRLQATKVSEHVNYRLSMQKGNIDYPFTSVEFLIIYHLLPKIKHESD